MCITNRKLPCNLLLAISIVGTVTALSFSSPTYARGPGGNHGGGGGNSGSDHRINDDGNFGSGHRMNDGDNNGSDHRMNDGGNSSFVPGQFPGQGKTDGIFPGDGETQGVFPGRDRQGN